MSRLKWEAKSDTQSMVINDNLSPIALTTYEWAMMAQECRLISKLVSRQLAQSTDKICTVWPGLQDELLELGTESSVLEGIGAVFLQQCGSTLKIAAEIPKDCVTC